MKHHAAKLPVEQAIFESDMQYTILHPTRFYQNFAQQWDKIVQTGKLVSPFSIHSQFAFVDYRDVSEVAASALTLEDDRLAYGVFNLCAEGNYSYQDIAHLISEVIDQSITAEQASPKSWASSLNIPTDSEEWKLLEAMLKYYDNHGLPGNSVNLRAVLDHEPRSLKDYITELASAKR